MKYIPADKLVAEIERFSATEYDSNTLGDDVANSALDFVLKEIIPSLQQEPRFPQYDSVVDKVFGAGNLEGFEYREAEMLVALAKEELLKSIQQEQPDFDDVDPKHLVHSHYTKVREIKTGRVFWAEYSSEAAEWYEAGTGKACSISDVEIVKEQPEADLQKDIECSIRFLNGHHTLENGERRYKGRYEELRDFARHFYELGLNARKK